MRRVAVIPARGGSKGVPRKNVRLVAGKPLVAWAIEAAKASTLTDEVIVSTDDDEIASVSERFGARVIRRPPVISGDTASSESALLHVLDVLNQTGERPEEVVFLQCTSPLTTGADIDACIEKLEAECADSAFTAKEFFYFVWKRLPDGSAEGVNHSREFRPRRQDREPQFEENGAVYVMKTDGFLKARHRFFGKTVISLMPESRSLEIDTEFDLKVAEQFLVRPSCETQPARSFPQNLKAVVFDFDGVMTDDCVLTGTSGDEYVRCSREDGQGVSRAKRIGVRQLILSSEENAVVTTRANKLGIEAIRGVGILRKCDVLVAWAKHQGIPLSDVVFMGNDLNDVDCMQSVGFAIAPSSASAAAKAAADFVTTRRGGEGAVREALEFIVRQLGKNL